MILRLALLRFWVIVDTRPYKLIEGDIRMKHRKRLKQYSEFSFKLPKTHRGILKSEKRFFAHLGYRTGDYKKYSSTEIATLIWDYIFLWQWKFKKLNHYFLAPGVLDACTEFLREDLSEYFNVPFVEDVDNENNNEPSLLPPPNPISIITGSLEDAEIPKCFFLHFPLNERRDSVMVSAPASHDEVGRIFLARYGASGEEILISNRWKKAGQRQIETLRAVLGFQLYANAFPETITRDGNLGIMDLHKYQGGKRYVKASKITSSEIESARSPHWRRGHFRLLSSDRYKHKQGKTVFVKGCFVRGAAHSVTSTARPESNSEPQQL